MSNDQLMSLTELMIRNMESTRYSLLHIDEVMNDINSLIILNNYKIIIIILSQIKLSYNICGKQLKYLNMYLSRLQNIIGTDARNTSAQRVGHDHIGLCEHAPSIQHVKNSELRENATYESILYFTHHKTLKCTLEL